MVDKLVGHNHRNYHTHIRIIRLGYERKYYDGYSIHNRHFFLDRSIMVGWRDILVVDYDFLLCDVQVIFYGI